MSSRRVLALAVVVGLASGSVPGTVISAQANGTLAGTASAEAKKPYDDFQVQLRDPATAQVVKTGPLDGQGLFSLTGVPLSRRLIVELYNKKQNKVVCTEGPYTLTASASMRTDVNINCGTTPAAWWLLLAGAGAVTGIAAIQASGGN